MEIGELKPKEIHVPGVFVHRIYQGSNYTKQFGGAIVAMFNQKENFVRRKIAQRAAKEVLPGMNLNLGIGIPTLTTKFIPKEWNVFVHSENGLLGVTALAAHEEADSNFDLTNASIVLQKKIPLFKYLLGKSHFASWRVHIFKLNCLWNHQRRSSGYDIHWSDAS